MRIEKIFGLVLLIVGIGIIFWALYSSYNVFSGKANLPEFFKFEKKEVKTSTVSKEKMPTYLEEIQKQMGEIVSEQLKEILPVDILSRLLNLVVWSIFAGILIFGGSQIASLGIKLLK